MPTPNSPEGDDLDRQLGRMTRRGLVWGGSAVVAGLAARRWVVGSPLADRLQWPLRKVLELDESVARAGFGSSRLSTEFDPSRAGMPRVNGRYGLKTPLDRDAWRLQVSGAVGSKSLELAEVRALPRHEVTTELRCIEGWSRVVTWVGARLSDLAERTGLAVDPSARPGDLLPYVALATPDNQYFVGLDLAAAMHPQTLLCYEMNGRPLEPLHGAPLRLAIPVKYGVKSLKRIGTLRFTDRRPRDFWAELGYDWYAGL